MTWTQPKPAAICSLGLILAGTGLQLGHVAALRPLEPTAYRRPVGAVHGKCCMPGRRWGCDPQNFGQSGCVPLSTPLENCQPRNWLRMACTGAACQTSNPEHVCSLDYRKVGSNVCHPTGERTTVGCPVDQWQCKVDMIDYTSKNAPKSDVLVCRYDVSTICEHNYSDCD